MFIEFSLLSIGAISAILLCIGLPIVIAIIVYYKEDSWYPKNEKSKSDIHSKASNDIKTELSSELSNKESFVKAYEVFLALGFQINAGVNRDDLYNKNLDYTKEPFLIIYEEFGRELLKESAENRNISNNCWLMHHEFVEDEDAYEEIMENFSRISNGEITFENLHSELDEYDSYISFVCRGKEYKWDIETNRSWVDIKFFWNIHQLTLEYNTDRKFTWFESGGNWYIFGFMTDEEMVKLKSETGIKTNRVKRNLNY